MTVCAVRSAPDLRLLGCAVAGWAGAWLGCSVAPALTVAVAIPMGAAGGALLLPGVRRWSAGLLPTAVSAAVAAALVVGAGAAVCAGARVAAVGSGPVAGLAAERAVATVDLVLTGDPRRVRVQRPGRPEELVLVSARVERVRARGAVTAVRSPVLVFADASWLELLPSQRVRVTGRFASSAPHDGRAALFRVLAHPSRVEAASGTQRAADRLRDGLRASVSGLPDGRRGLVPGLVLGDTSAMPQRLLADFRTAGLTHLVAVSGANIAIMLVVVLGIGRWVGLSVRAAPLLGALTMAGFLILARPEPSLLRATAMGAVGVLALASGRGGRGMPALCAAVVALVLIDPWLARSYGFALSVLATGGLIGLAPRWQDRLAGYVPRPVAAAVAIPASAQLLCAPVIVLLSAQVSLVAIPANLLAAPAVAPATVLGVAASVTSVISPAAASVLGTASGVPAAWIVLVAERCAAMPGASIAWLPGLGGALVLAGVCLLAGVWLAVRPGRRARADEGGGRVADRRRPLGWATVIAVLAAAIALALLVPLLRVPRWWSGWPPPGWVVVVCDVGQGDAVVLPAGPRTAVVVDAGPEPDRVDACLRRLGVTTVGYLLLTHFHADHVDGLPGVLRGRTVGEVGVSPWPEPAEGAAGVRARAARAGVPVTVAVPGRQRRFGDLRWRVLWPRRLIAEGSAANNASVVLMAESRGVRVLLTGDIEPAAQRALLGAEPRLDAEVLKVPHHGSAHQDHRFLQAVGAEIAVASVGADNDYGHPSATTVQVLRHAGARFLRTDRDGDVAVTGSPGRLRVTGREGVGVGPLPAGIGVGPLPPGKLVGAPWDAARDEYNAGFAGPAGSRAGAARAPPRRFAATRAGHAGGGPGGAPGRTGGGRGPPGRARR